MTLPASGSITMSAIEAELAAGFPMALRDADVLALAERTGQTVIMPTHFYSKSSAEPSSSYDEQAASDYKVGAGTSTADMVFGTSGSVTATLLNDTSGARGSWFLPEGGTPGASYWVKAVKASGNTPNRGSALNTVIALSGSPSWGLTVTRSGSQGTLSLACVLTVTIYSNSSGTTQVATGIVTISAGADGGL